MNFCSSYADAVHDAESLTINCRFANHPIFHRTFHIFAFPRGIFYVSRFLFDSGPQKEKRHIGTHCKILIANNYKSECRFLRLKIEGQMCICFRIIFIFNMFVANAKIKIKYISWLDCLKIICTQKKLIRLIDESDHMILTRTLTMLVSPNDVIFNVLNVMFEKKMKNWRRRRRVFFAYSFNTIQSVNVVFDLC